MPAGTTLTDLEALLELYRNDGEIDGDELDNILITVKNILKNNDTSGLDLAYSAGTTYDTPATAASSGRPAYAEDGDRLWKSKVDDNIGNQPPQDSATTEDAYWVEISKASITNFPEWESNKLYGTGLILVFWGDHIYKLMQASRPFSSSTPPDDDETNWKNVTGDYNDLTNLPDLAKGHYSFFSVAGASAPNNRNRLIQYGEERFWTLGVSGVNSLKFGYFDIGPSAFTNLSGAETFNHFDVYNGVPYLVDGSATGKLVKYENGVFTNIDISATVGADSLNFIEIYNGIAYIAGNAGLYQYDIVGEIASTILTCDAGIICMEYSTSNKLYIAGFFTSLTLTGGSAETHNYIAEYDIVLDTLTSVGTGLNAAPTKLIYSTNLYIFGNGLTTLNGTTISKVCAMDVSTYAVDDLGNPALTDSGTPVINDFTLTPNGDVVVVGDFETIDGVAAENIALYKNSAWQKIEFITDDLNIGLSSIDASSLTEIKFIASFGTYGLWLSGGGGFGSNAGSCVISQGLYWNFIRSYYYERSKAVISSAIASNVFTLDADRRTYEKRFKASATVGANFSITINNAVEGSLINFRVTTTVAGLTCTFTGATQAQASDDWNDSTDVLTLPDIGTYQLSLEYDGTNWLLLSTTVFT